MPSKSLHKIQKHISRKKGAKNPALHARSRDSQRLLRASARADKLAKAASARARQNEPYLRRCLYFQTLALQRTTPPSEADILAAIHDYTHRHAADLATLTSQRREGRPPSSRDAALKHSQAAEEAEFASGYWVPDLREEGNLAKLRAWDGEWVALATVGFVRVTREGAWCGSRFPPGGGE